MVCARRTRPSPFGEIAVTPMSRAVFGEGGPSRFEEEQFQVIWSPPNPLRANLPEEFELEFACYVDCDGIRRFVPMGGYETFIHRAFLAGVAIRVHEERLDLVDRNLFYARHHFFQRARRMPEHFDRHFNTSSDIDVRPAGRGGGIGRTVLPREVVFDKASRPVSVTELTRRGRELAASAGLRNPTNQIAIHYAFVEIARQDPLFLRDDEAAMLVRTALYEESSIGRQQSPELLEMVTNRQLEWIASHLDKPRGKFDLGYFPGKGSFVKAIAQHRRKPGGILPHDDVRRAILELGWQAYADVTRSLVRSMSWFMDAMPVPLSPMEREVFERMHFPQRYLGGLPFVLLAERAGFIRNVIRDLWEDPADESLVGMLHRLLDLYRQMAVTRRQADNNFKRNRGNDGQVVLEVTGMDWKVSSEAAPRKSLSVFGAIGEYLANRQGLTCDHCGGDWSAKVIEGIEPERSPTPRAMIVLEVACHFGRVHDEVSMSAADFERVAEPFLPDH